MINFAEHSNRKSLWVDRAATLCLWITGILVLAIVALFLIYILYKGLPSLSVSFLLGMPTELSAGGGIAPQFFNSIYILLLSLAFSLPIAIGAGVYLAEYAGTGKIAGWIRLSTECLATVPSIVLGLFGLIVFVNIMGLRFSILSGALTLVLLNVPLLVRVTEESLRMVPDTYREASMALGATKWQTIWRILLPNALPGILTGITLTAGRVMGETAILIFTAGTTFSRNTPDFSMSAPGETLAVHLWYVMGVGLVPDRVAIANGIGALLILAILVLNLLLTIPGRIWRKKQLGRQS